MSKKLLLERFQELAGIKSLYELDPRRPKDKEFDDAQAMGRLPPDDREKLKMTQQMMGNEKEFGTPLNPNAVKDLGMDIDGLRLWMMDLEEEIQIYVPDLYPSKLGESTPKVHKKFYLKLNL